MAARLRYVVDNQGDRRLVDWDEMVTEMQRLREAGVDLEAMGTKKALAYTAASLERRRQGRLN